MLLVTSWLLARRRAEALWVYAALLLGTVVWAVWEAGFDFWSLAPRGDVLAPLGVWLLLPFIARRLVPRSRAARWALGLVLIGAAIVLGVSLTHDRHDLAGILRESDVDGRNCLVRAGPARRRRKLDGLWRHRPWHALFLAHPDQQRQCEGPQARLGIPNRRLQRT